MSPADNEKNRDTETDISTEKNLENVTDAARREGAITRSFVALATSLAAGADIVDLLTRLTGDCARLLDITSAGLLLNDGHGVLHVMAASSEETQRLELFQTQRDEGPCLDCFHSATRVSVPDLAAQDRWPTFTAAAQRHGFSSVHAVPMRLRTHTIGALGLFGEHPGNLNVEDLTLAQALADVASVALVQHETSFSPPPSTPPLMTSPSTASPSTASPSIASPSIASPSIASPSIASPSATPPLITLRLQEALHARMLVEQAKGVLAYRGKIGTHTAFESLRAYADSHDQRLSTVAGWVVHGDLPATVILEHAPTPTPTPI